MEEITAWSLSKGDRFQMFGDDYCVTSVYPAFLSEFISKNYSYDDVLKVRIVATRADGNPEDRYIIFLPRLAKIKVWRSRDGVRQPSF